MFLGFSAGFLLIASYFLLGQPTAYPGSRKTVTSSTVDLRQSGLRIYKPGKCYNGYSLYAHLVPGIQSKLTMNPLYLVDMKGNVVHKWIVNTSVGHGLLRPNGNLLYSTSDMLTKENPAPSTSGLREIDPESNLLWFYRACIQHDFRDLGNGTFMIERYEMIPLSAHDEPGYVIHPRIEIIDREKKVLWGWKGEEHIGELEKSLGIKVKMEGDWAHNNYCEILPENPSGKKDIRFRKGNIVFSYAQLDAIGIIEYPSGKIVWAWGPGVIDGQHTPTMLANGNLLIFDNGQHRGWSRVIEVDPVAEDIVWEYHAEPKESFYSDIISSAFPLPNGNIFICDGVHARLFEITRGGEIVWDFISTLGRTSGAYAIPRANRYSPRKVRSLLD